MPGGPEGSVNRGRMRCGKRTRLSGSAPPGGANAMSVARIAIGGLMLEHDERWIFVVHADGDIVGRRYNDVGALRIRHVERNTLPDRLTHEYCLATACRMLNVPDHPVDSLDALETPWGPYGAATIIDAAH